MLRRLSLAEDLWACQSSVCGSSNNGRIVFSLLSQRVFHSPVNFSERAVVAFLENNFDRVEVSPDSNPKVKKAAKKINRRHDRAKSCIVQSKERGHAFAMKDAERRGFAKGAVVRVKTNSTKYKGKEAAIVGPSKDGKMTVRFVDPALGTREYVVGSLTLV
jgi:hypothetical protein